VNKRFLMCRKATTDGFSSARADFSNACANFVNDADLLSDLADDMYTAHDNGTLNDKILEAYGMLDELEVQLRTMRRKLDTLSDKVD